MSEIGKWEVSYTKHLKQKRKLYHDGTLLLLSNNKVMLYDESENVLDSKFLNKHEAAALALALNPDSLAFSSFLVDVGLPLTSSSSIPSPAPRKPSFNKKPSSSNSLSPSHKIITEFKKYQSANYAARHTSPTAAPSLAPSSTQEWEALYTTQMTQKAKKYHDGFIRLIISGSQSRQVALYDSTRTQIDKRFLKKDEVISSGESLNFDAHLVEIGDALGNNANDAEVKKEATNSTPHQLKNSWQRPKLSKENLVHNRQRCEEPTRQNHLKTGKSQNDAGSRKGLDLGFDVSRVDKMKPKRTPLSQIPPRDVNHILSILKKPAVPDNISMVEKAAVAVQSDTENKAFESTGHSDPQSVVKVTNEFDCNEVAERGTTQIGCTDNYHPPEITNDNIVRDQATEASNNAAVESPDKVESSANQGKSAIHQPVQLPSFTESISAEAGIEETKSTHQQPCAKLPEINAPSKEGTSGSANKSKAKRVFSGLGGMKKILKNNVNTELPTGTLDCPSFDLGI